MGVFAFDSQTEPGILKMKLSGRFTVAEMEAFVEEHDRRVDSFGQDDYRVWVDLTELAPLSQECTAIMERAKRHSRDRPNFRGSAVLVATPTIALQHRRTSIDAGVMGTELISTDPRELSEHLKRVARRP